MRSVKVSATPGRAGAGNRQVNNDRLKLVILAGFVLFVFWSGVAVGVGFSHGHNELHQVPGGLHWIRSTRGQERAKEREAIGQGQQTMSLENNPPKTNDCCQGDELECIACRKHMSVAAFCIANPGYKGCSVGDAFAKSGPSQFKGKTYYVTESTALDFYAVTLSAWIYLEEDEIQNMKTIVANRASGCSRDNGRRGYAFYVNEWATDDRSLNIMWHDERDACMKLKTSPGVIKYKTWHHVGATLEMLHTGELKVNLYVDGELKASTVSPRTRLVGALPHNTFVVGAHTQGGDLHSFTGRIAHVTVVDGISESIASSFPNAIVPTTSNAGVKAFFKNFEGEMVVDSIAGHKLVRKKEGYSPEDGGAAQISYLVEPGDESELAAGSWPRNTFYLTKELKEKSDALARERRELVRNAMKHAYGSYEKHAFGADEVTPRSGQRKNNWGGMAVTLLDALDTLWIMGMKEEFYRGRDYCRDHLRFNNVGSVSTFETTIRALGGLMSAYDLSQDEVFLERARDLGDRLSRAFETPSGLPAPSVALNSGSRRQQGNVVIAEVGTLQVEFRALAYAAKDPKYARKVENVHAKMRASPPADGLWPIYVSLDTGRSTGGVVTFGALGDSFFEYLLKIWVQGGKTETQYLVDYERAMDGMHRLVVQRSTPSNLAYLADYNPGGHLNHKMDHLACFVPAMLALGVRKRGNSPEHQFKNDRDLTVAKALTYTCVQMYLRQPTGISPEYVNWQHGKDMTVPANAPFYILRPEAVEALYVLHAVTGHPIYRDWGHQIMLNIEKFCKLQYGYGSLPDVRAPNRPPDDRMESFFLAETLKYLYLLQDPDATVNLDEWVFNTEAHPVKVLPPGWRAKIGLE